MVRQNERGDPEASMRGAPVAAPMVDRAFHVLDLLAAREESYRLSELARALGMSKGSMHGLLKTMQQRGVVELDGDQRYLLGPRIYDLAQTYIRRGGLRGLALPAMRRLAERSGETVFLGQIESDAVRIVELAEAPSEHAALRVAARRGTRIPLLAGAIGRVVLARWPAARRAEYLQAHALPRFTERSITTPAAYLAAVEETERTGIGEEHEEYITGVNAVAAGIHGLGGEPIALLWIAGSSSRFTAGALQQSAEALRAEAQGISQALGA
ncbi:MAG TPA: IclR family transcriptional regulator [Ktedonobacterales bacterium]|nr:IclR family transcriptional regulator [Ktedonobacterales bacterium]